VAHQPHSVTEIADLLFPAYRVDGGRVSLAGCAIEDRPQAQLQFFHEGQLIEVYTNLEGKEVDGSPLVGEKPPELACLDEAPVPFKADLDRLLVCGKRLIAERLPAQADAESSIEVVKLVIVWCKHVDGKLRFTIGDTSLDVPFAGWTCQLRSPHVVCPYTGAITYHLAATEDGRIAAAERIECCHESGRRLLATELVTCSVTGYRVAPDLVDVCPISGRRLLRKAMVACSMCRQRVSPSVLERGQCLACRRLRAVRKADPRMARILHEHPALDRWRSWRIGETSRVYVLATSGWLKHLLVVVDKDSLELRHLATGGRFSSRWIPAAPAQYAYVLSE
jgi:hypothetical protein